ncbi:DUF1778 domain-containing protein [Bradyrhizobium sp. SRL28]|uniref:type II toxin-antitoxin system TacA family antitoxin n=1 Tax=Bradyrhizobium sp. SRL28 TaxID=2836178 RepID=UPI001BDF1695|nr:DUF1778 domain-containing protein [Bradyrhizobium sp. SRL28]MBT1513264.1 DUF1778 domain-containing protein [Bradyrhizobium sp. SRL28]
MLKTEKETKARAKAKVKAHSLKETAPSKVRRRKVQRVPEAAYLDIGFATHHTNRLARLELPKEAMSRLEARIPTALYEVMERAAQLRGLTMTAYVTSVMVSDARHTIEESSSIKLSRDDQAAFAKALIEPPAPNAKLVAAARRHAALIR